MHVALGSDPYLNAKGKYDHRSFTPLSFLWPVEEQRAVDWIERSAQRGDVYACPYLMHDNAEGRAEWNAAGGYRLVHTDVDTAIDLTVVAKLGAFAVGSGTSGHGHVYAKLLHVVMPAQHEVLCKALCAYLGGDPAKHSDNDLLRPAGTLNHKPTVSGGAPTPVVFL